VRGWIHEIPLEVNGGDTRQQSGEALDQSNVPAANPEWQTFGFTKSQMG